MCTPLKYRRSSDITQHSDCGQTLKKLYYNVRRRLNSNTGFRIQFGLQFRKKELLKTHITFGFSRDIDKCSYNIRKLSQKYLNSDIDKSYKERFEGVSILYKRGLRFGAFPRVGYGSIWTASGGKGLFHNLIHRKTYLHEPLRKCKRNNDMNLGCKHIP